MASPVSPCQTRVLAVFRAWVARREGRRHRVLRGTCSGTMSTEDIDRPHSGTEEAELNTCTPKVGRIGRQQRGGRADESTLHLVSSPGRIRIFLALDHQLRVPGNRLVTCNNLPLLCVQVSMCVRRAFVILRLCRCVMPKGRTLVLVLAAGEGAPVWRQPVCPNPLPLAPSAPWLEDR